MKRRVRTAGLAVAAAVLHAWVLCPVALAQAPVDPLADPELKAIVSLYDHGHYEEVLERARGRIDRGGLGREELVLLHQYAGLSSFNLGDEDRARRHFQALLRLDPDFGLDPFSVAPPAIALFNQLKKDLEPQLEIIRQQRRVEADRQRREAEERAQRQREDEERRRRLEDLSRQVTVRTVEKRSFFVNFLPFGAPQLQQKRTTLGVALAATEGAAALTSIVAYFVIESMIAEDRYYVDTDEGRQFPIRRGIPREELEVQRNRWVFVKHASAGAFYTLYSFGVVDGIYNHQSEVVHTTTLRLPPDSPAPPPASPRDPADGAEPPPPEPEPIPLGPGVTGQAPKANYFLFPMAGGVGAGLHLRF